MNTFPADPSMMPAAIARLLEGHNITIDCEGASLGQLIECYDALFATPSPFYGPTHTRWINISREIQAAMVEATEAGRVAFDKFLRNLASLLAARIGAASTEHQAPST